MAPAATAAAVPRNELPPPLLRRRLHRRAPALGIGLALITLALIALALIALTLRTLLLAPGVGTACRGLALRNARHEPRGASLPKMLLRIESRKTARLVLLLRSPGLPLEFLDVGVRGLQGFVLEQNRLHQGVGGIRCARNPLADHRFGIRVARRILKRCKAIEQAGPSADVPAVSCRPPRDPGWGGGEMGRPPPPVEWHHREMLSQVAFLLLAHDLIRPAYARRSISHR